MPELVNLRGHVREVNPHVVKRGAPARSGLLRSAGLAWVLAKRGRSPYLEWPMARSSSRPPAPPVLPDDAPAGRTPAGAMASPHGAERFNEDKATYVLRGADQPDLDRGVAVLRDVIATLKPVPGVYRMIDARGDVLYVGKARALKNRVANYVQVDRLPNRLRRMVSLTRSMTIVTTNSEAEALLLEAQLIKRYRPAYNVLLRDDKSFPFILLRSDHGYPRLMKHRGARRAKGNYYGPFASAGSVNTTINALQKLFLLRSCNDGFMARRDRPCLLYQIKRCSAPCVGRISEADYAELVRQAKDFLGGKSSAVQREIETQMAAAAEALDFERAAVMRDRLRAATFIQGSQAINAEGVGNADVFAMAIKGGQVAIQAFFIRGGQNWGHRAFFPSHTEGHDDGEVMTLFLAQFYEDVPPPRLILVDRDLPEAVLLAEALQGAAGGKVEISVPQRGDRRRLMEQAQRNADEALDRRMAETGTKAKIFRELADFLELGDPPDRIEIYDNSHIMGTNAVGAMVVAGPEGFRKGQYRKFNIKRPETEPGDDFGMMREVMSRRFARAQEEDPDRDRGMWPDLVLIDGGKGQMTAVRETLEELGIEDVALIAVSKGPDRNAGREHFHFPDGREKLLPLNSPLLFHLQLLRDEAHRFAIGAHRAKRSRAITASPLDEVPGIGPARKRALLLHFGTAGKVRAASLEDLQRAPGVSVAVAQTVYDFYHPSG
jgi:excinuclease ABC subunit C